MQKVRELAPLLGLLRRLKQHVVVEIGSARGGTLFAWAHIARDDALLVSVDLPGGAFGGRQERVDVGALARRGQAVEAIRGDSHQQETFERLLSVLGGRPVDMLFIDGDHSYAGVRGDFEMYAPLVRTGGLVVIHDIIRHPPESACEVDRFWAELKAGRRTLELVDRGGSRYGGIGVVFADPDQRSIASR
jgi:predicted O-methyltransferase YrrM